MTSEAKKVEAIERVSKAVLETIQEAGELGAPGGHLYVAMQLFGMTLTQYQQFMAGLAENGCVAHEGDCYTITVKGTQYLARLQQKFPKAA